MPISVRYSVKVWPLVILTLCFFLALFSAVLSESMALYNNRILNQLRFSKLPRQALYVIKLEEVNSTGQQ